jgi:hypothetical protein
MSCCAGDKEVPVDRKAKVDILANLPQAVLAANDPSHPLASSIRNALPPSKPGVTVHDDGSLEYPVGGVGPPPAIVGFERDSQNPHLFRPQWNECQLRLAGIRRDTKTGAIKVSMVCNNPEVPQYMGYVKVADCTNCPKRKNPA